MSIIIIILFVFFMVLGLILFFISSRDRSIVFLFLFLFLIFLDFIFVFYSLSYIISHLDFSGNSYFFNQYFIFLIILSFLQACLLVLFSIFGDHFLSYNFFYPTDVKIVSSDCDKVGFDLERFSVDKDRVLEYNFGERYVINYSNVFGKVLDITSCFSSINGSLNFFYGGESSFEDFVLFLKNVSINYHKGCRNVFFHLFDYSFFIYKEIVKVKGEGFISYEDFLKVFILYCNWVFYDCVINSGIFFCDAILDLSVEFWLGNLDSEGKFLDSFLESISKNPHSYYKSNSCFSIELYDFNNPLHSSSKLVWYSSLSFDFERIKSHSKSYRYKSTIFARDNSYFLRREARLISAEDWRNYTKSCKHTPEYEVFLKFFKSF